MKIAYITTGKMSSKSSGGLHARQYGFYKSLQRNFEVDAFSEHEKYDPDGIDEQKRSTKIWLKLFTLLPIIFGFKAIASKDKFAIGNEKMRKLFSGYDVIFCSYINSAHNFLNLDCASKKVCDLVDSHSLHYQEYGGNNILRKLIYFINIKPTKKLEQKVINSFDKCIVTAAFEKNWLSKELKINDKKICVIENGIQLYSRPPYDHHTKVFRNVAFIGSLDYYPNREAVEVICSKLSRDFLRLSINVKIIGANNERLKKKYAKFPNVEFMGFIPNLLFGLSDVRIMILPLSTASGIQNKLLTSLSLGKVSIIPRRMVFNEKLVSQNCVVIYDSVEDIPSIVNSLFMDVDKLNKMSHNAWKFSQDNLSWGYVEDKLTTAINETLAT